MTENGKIAAIGPRQQMLALKSIGVKTFDYDANRHVEAMDKLIDLAEGEALSLILLSESLAEGMGAEAIANIREETGTVIMAIPSHEGSAGLTEEWFKEAMEHSIGVDLISD